MTKRRLVASVFAVVLVASSTFGLSQPSDRVFEMRTYVTAPGDINALHKLLSAASTGVLRRHKITSVAYWRPRDAPSDSRLQARLIAVFAYPSMDAARQSWSSVVGDAEWQLAFKAANVKMTSSSVYMDPTDFSPVK